MQVKLFAVALLAAVVSTSSLQAQTTTVYLVRHAEKEIDASNRNPDLNAAGRTRAAALARTLRSAKLDACFSSRWKRTQLTAAPVAKVAKLQVTTRRAGNEKLLAAQIIKDYAGKTVLFVGHSNTVPDLMKHLGVEKSTIPELSEKDYDNLFQVRITKDGKISMTHLHYGAVDPK